jgi:hypothetical protein
MVSANAFPMMGGIATHAHEVATRGHDDCLEAPPKQVADVALAVAAATPPPVLPSWDDCAEQLHRLYREVTA